MDSSLLILVIDDAGLGSTQAPTVRLWSKVFSFGLFLSASRACAVLRPLFRAGLVECRPPSGLSFPAVLVLLALCHTGRFSCLFFGYSPGPMRPSCAVSLLPRLGLVPR